MRTRDSPALVGVTTSGRGLLSSSDVGSANRARLLQSLVDDGPASRAELARRIKVPRATISSIVSGLLDSGVLIEEEPQPPVDGIGKPPRPLWFAPDALQCGAISVSRGAVDVAVVNARGEILSRRRVPIAPDGRTAELDRQILAAASAALADFRGRLSGIGLTVPALCDSRTSAVVACTPVPGLVGTRLPQLLAERFGVPCVLEQDVRAFAVGEKWFGQARGVRDFAALQFGVGVGAGVMLLGHLVSGRDGHTVQLGHTCVDPAGRPCSCGLRGCWETLTSSHWLRSEAVLRGIPGGRDTTPKRLAGRAAAGDQLAASLLADFSDNIAIGIANLVQLLSLQLFIIHGDVVHAGESFRAHLQASVLQRCMPALAHGVRVEFSELDQDSGLLGAAATVLTRELGVTL
ncbi:Sugar kinase of the NBD/HSP70 family, may contain an N-terminal HTH domain [Nakamurella panacisegetis]|uniref:Sugar kinase of the NBD/HSP70 family, may contain an N-terminal HTH domain n=1 Tax=Nakamurella panacisegetis TaxID=1090615 RepID=A0A1H0QSU7_9ACTN|nr:Sugar kinase of the NBD/HSP70 family, may contain an N-terminal HTH domain [Nakamurella panacisegetis]